MTSSNWLVAKPSSWLAPIRRLLITGVILVAGLIPAIIGYFIYLALSLHEPTWLVLCWVGLALWLGFAVIDNEQLGWRQKLGFIIGIPVTYIPLYLLALTQIFGWLGVNVFSIGKTRP